MNENYVTLGQVCDKGSSNIAQKDLAEREGQYPIYGAAGLIKNVDFAHQKQPYIAVVKDGAGIGRVMKLPAYSSVIGTMQYIFPKENVDIDYLFYALQHMNLGKYFSGSTIPHIYFRDYQKERLKLPVMEVQQRQADTLSRIDALSAYGQRQIALMDEIVKSRFVEMFGDRNYPHTALINLIKDGMGLSYGIVQPGDDGTGEMGVLRPVDMADGKISMASIKYIDRSIGDGFRKTELTGDELLITVRGTTGVTALTDIRFAGMNVTRGIAVIRYDREKINPVYLNAYLNTDESQRYIQEHTRGATLQQINLSDLRVQEVVVPPTNLQNCFAAFVAEVDKSKLAVQQSLEKLETLKKSLMQQYFG